MKIYNFQYLWLFDENKLKILHTLRECQMNKKICGCDLIGTIGIPKNLLSYHIKILREKDFVEEVKCGRRKEYQIKEDKLKIVDSILELVLEK